MKASSFKLVAVIVLALCVNSVSFAQVDQDGNDRRFYDDLLDKLVGKWEVSAIVHGEKFTLEREAEWVMSHQYLRIYEKSREVIPWLKTQFERTIFIGYNHSSKRYLVYELTVHGGDGPFKPEGFWYADRTGNELKMVLTNGSEALRYQRFTWHPETRPWRFQGGRLISGKEAPDVDQTAVAAEPSPKSQR